MLVVIAVELLTPFGDGQPTANPTRVEAVRSHFERMKPLLDVVSIAIIDLTAQP